MNYRGLWTELTIDQDVIWINTDSTTQMKIKEMNPFLDLFRVSDSYIERLLQ